MREFKPRDIPEIIDVGTRRSGRTTRIADQAIQTLFEKGEIVIVDHHNTEMMSNHLCKIIVGRLMREHGFESMKHYVVVKPKFDQTHFKIKLLRK